MLIIARIADYEISEADIALDEGEQESSPEQLRSLKINTLSHLIDSYLLFIEAMSHGIKAEEQEFDEAFMHGLEELDDSSNPLNTQEAEKLELKITRKIVVKKYIHHLCQNLVPIDDEQLSAFYEDQKEAFMSPPKARASHILIRKDSPDSFEKAQKIRASLHKKEDFLAACTTCSDCPSHARCGDLGYFSRGQMIPAIDEMAFSMEVGQISPVFESPYGYHILMLTDLQEPAIIPFEEIKESLKSRLIALERQFFLAQHIRDLRNQYRFLVQILDDEYQQVSAGW